METLKLTQRYNKLFNEYKSKSMEMKHKIVNDNNKPKLRKDCNNKQRKIYENILKDKINKLNRKINKLGENKFTNNILIKMLLNLQKYGYNESIAKKYINDIDKIINNEIKKDDEEFYFINITNKIGKTNPALLSLIYDDIREYFEFKRSSKVEY